MSPCRLLRFDRTNVVARKSEQPLPASPPALTSRRRRRRWPHGPRANLAFLLAMSPFGSGGQGGRFLHMKIVLTDADGKSTRRPAQSESVGCRRFPQLRHRASQARGVADPV